MGKKIKEEAKTNQRKKESLKTIIKKSKTKCEPHQQMNLNPLIELESLSPILIQMTILNKKKTKTTTKKTMITITIKMISMLTQIQIQMIVVCRTILNSI